MDQPAPGSPKIFFLSRIAPALSICLWVVAALSLLLAAGEGFPNTIVILAALLMLLVNIFISSLARKTNKKIGQAMLFLTIVLFIFAMIGGVLVSALYGLGQHGVG